LRSGKQTLRKLSGRHYKDWMKNLMRIEETLDAFKEAYKEQQLK
jgi:hypothetical protein